MLIDEWSATPSPIINPSQVSESLSPTRMSDRLHMKYTPGRCHCASLAGDKIVFFGGGASTSSSDVLVLDTKLSLIDFSEQFSDDEIASFAASSACKSRKLPFRNYLLYQVPSVKISYFIAQIFEFLTVTYSKSTFIFLNSRSICVKDATEVTESSSSCGSRINAAVIQASRSGCSRTPRKRLLLPAMVLRKVPAPRHTVRIHFKPICYR